MYVCICMYMYVYVCICMYMYVYVCICMYMYVYVCMYVCMTHDIFVIHNAKHTRVYSYVVIYAHHEHVQYRVT